MRLSDFVILCAFISFFWFNEGIIAKAPRWQNLVSRVEVGLFKAFTWRANADVRSELDVLIPHFKKLSIATGVVFVISTFLKSEALMFWTSSSFLLCFFAWFSFRWTFKHRDAVQPFAPMVGWSLLAPWAVCFFDYLEPKAGFMQVFHPAFEFVGRMPASSLEAAWWIFLVFICFFGIYYALIWILVTPFTYGILVALKGSCLLSKLVLKHVSRALVFEVSIAIQLFAFIYLYWIGRPG